MEEQQKPRSAANVGVTWGGIGAVLGFCVSLLGSLAGMVAATFIGVSVGRRAADADGEDKSGALAGLVGGAIAAPAVVVGATAGALVSVRSVNLESIAVEVSGMLGATVTTDETWRLILLAVAIAAVFQIILLIGASTAAGAWAAKKRATTAKRDL